MAYYQPYQFGPQTPYSGVSPQVGSMYPQAAQIAPAPAAVAGNGFIVRPVTSKEEAVAAQVDFFVSGTLMPDLAHGVVYLKRFNQNTGSSDFFEFSLKTEPAEPPVEYATKADLEALRAELTKKKKKEVVEDDD